jgi:ABC-type glycerol-3-phosphate transport system permease component
VQPRWPSRSLAAIASETSVPPNRLGVAGPDAAPLTMAIRDQTRQFGSNIDVISAGAFLSMIVPPIVFFAFQRYFVEGVLAGSVK